MALYKTTLATNFFATPPVKSNPQETGRAFNRGASISLTTDHDSADVIILFPVPTNICVRALLLSTDGGAAAGAGDFGLYTLNAAGDTATEVDKDLFASAQAITSALTRSDITGESTTVTIDERFKPLWEVAGASADPGGVYWVCMTVTTNVDATNVIGVEIEGTF